METLAQRHAKEENERKAIEKMIKILGRTEQLPRKFKSKQIHTPYDKPEVVLGKAGYKDIKRGWIKKCKGGRYHAYTYEKVIYLHKDIISNGKHRATNKNILDEQEWIEKFRTPVVVELPPSEYKDKVKEVEEANRQMIRKKMNWFKRLFGVFYKLNTKR